MQLHTGWKTPLDTCQLTLNALGEFERVRARLLQNREHHTRSGVYGAIAVLGGGADDYIGDLPEKHWNPLSHGNHRLFHISDALDASDASNGVLLSPVHVDATGSIRV